ncbi:D-alanine--D-alanine ligase [Granulosicoccus sp. 3-233]|uniref:D-alanine--D-alanine ligase n=1 Tax=Granulosicoccus sp. 3-233 TaxID=3417969 RepID=UPI003D33734C
MVEHILQKLTIRPEQFGKVAVVMGGWSAEREVSLMSGQQVFDSLTSAGVDAHAVDAGRDIAAVLNDGRFDRAFLILHGRGGEDGIVQGSLELAGIPYTGSGVLASALCMDKWRAKGLVSLKGVVTPAAQEVFSLEQAEQAASVIGYPLVVKPTNEGSSIGVSMVNKAEQLAEAFKAARRYGPVLIEQRMTGIEVTAGIIGGVALPLVSMKGADEFYDYKAKYLADDTVYECPVDLPADVVAAIQEMALTAFSALDCRGWGRVDFMLDAEGQPNFIECNTAPGMTSHSLVPIAAREAGLDFPSLCLHILADTLSTEELAA